MAFFVTPPPLSTIQKAPQGHASTHSAQYRWALAILQSCWCWETVPGTQRPSLHTQQLSFYPEIRKSLRPGDWWKMVCNKRLGRQKALKPFIDVIYDVTKHRFITESTYQQYQQRLVRWPLLHGSEWNFERCRCTEDRFPLKYYLT